MARLWALFVRNLTILSLAFMPMACEQPVSPPAAGDPPADTLRLDVSNAFGSLNPANITHTGSNWVFPLIFSRLAQSMPDGHLKPELARYWHYDSRHRTLRVELRHDALFHNGLAVTARDVIFSVRQAADELPGIVDNIDQMVPVTEHALEMVLKTEDPLFFKRIHDMPILPRNVASTAQDSHPIGSGPYRFNPRSHTGQLLLTAFDGYYGGRPGIARVVFTHVPDKDQTWIRLMEAKTDVAVRLSPENFRRMGALCDRFHIHLSPSWFCKTLLFNTFDPRFADVRVRRALSLGIDRGLIVKKILLGYGRVATGPLGIDSPYGRKHSQPRPYDPGKARQLLGDAGWKRNAATGVLRKNGRALEFDLLFMRESPTDEQVARLIQLCLCELGVIIHPVPADFDTFTRSYFNNTEFQAVLTETMGLYDSCDPLVSTWLPPPHGLANLGGFTSPDLTRLLTAIGRASTIEEQTAICQAVEDHLLALQPAAFLYQPTEINAVSKRIDLPYDFGADSLSIRRLYTASIRPSR